MTHDSGPTLDLRGTPCPMNFVRIKLELDKLGPGSWLSVTADGGGKGRDILRSLEQQGFRVDSYQESDRSISFGVLNPAD